MSLAALALLLAPWPANAARPVERPSQESSIVSDTLAILAGGWGVLMAISPTLQIRRILERRSSDDVSLRYYGVLLVGFTLWVAYGLSIGNLALIVSNSVAFIVGSATIVIARRYRTAPAAAESASEG
jgi:MtN3 and saliva related transmembrane protein